MMIERKNKQVFQELRKKEFRVLLSTFDYIVDLVRDNIECQDTNLRTCTNEWHVQYGVWLV